MNALNQILKGFLITAFWIVIVRILEVVSNKDNDVLFFIVLALIQIYCLIERVEKDRK